MTTIPHDPAKKRWFSYSPFNGFVFHENKEDARAQAQDDLEYLADRAPYDGWMEETPSICWGPIAEVATEGERKYPICVECREEEDRCECPAFEASTEFDYIVDYTLESPEKA